MVVSPFSENRRGHIVRRRGFQFHQRRELCGGRLSCANHLGVRIAFVDGQGHNHAVHHHGVIVLVHGTLLFNETRPASSPAPPLSGCVDSSSVWPPASWTPESSDLAARPTRDAAPPAV